MRYACLLDVVEYSRDRDIITVRAVYCAHYICLGDYIIKKGPSIRHEIGLLIGFVLDTARLDL